MQTLKSIAQTSQHRDLLVRSKFPIGPLVDIVCRSPDRRGQIRIEGRCLLHIVNTSPIDWQLTGSGLRRSGSIKSGQIGVLLTDRAQEWSWCGEAKDNVLMVFDPQWFSALGGTFGNLLHEEEPSRVQTDSLIISLVDVICDQVLREDVDGRALVRSASELLSLHVLRKLKKADAHRPSRGQGGLAAWQLRRVKSAIETAAGETLSLHHLAKSVGLSPAHFCKAFQQSMGIPPHRWQMAQKISRAQHMMMDRSLSLTDIALSCGFASSSHFAKVFKKTVNMSASEYRRCL